MRHRLFLFMVSLSKLFDFLTMYFNILVFQKDLMKFRILNSPFLKCFFNYYLNTGNLKIKILGVLGVENGNQGLGYTEQT